MFMGSNTMKIILDKLEEDIEYINKPRLSKLLFTGHKKITKQPWGLFAITNKWNQDEQETTPNQQT